MEKTVDELLQAPYWIIDILPEQVPADGPGQYFAVEKYFLRKDRLALIQKKHIDLVLKLNCYRQLSVDGEANPPPERMAEAMGSRYLCIRVDGALIVSEPDSTYMTLYDPDEALLALVRALAAGEGLFVWQPPE